MSLKLQTLEDVILLTCDESEETDGEGLAESKRYRYSELKDLQSRLALVAGEKQREHIEIITAFEEVSGLYLFPKIVKLSVT